MASVFDVGVGDGAGWLLEEMGEDLGDANAFEIREFVSDLVQVLWWDSCRNELFESRVDIAGQVELVAVGLVGVAHGAFWEGGGACWDVKVTWIGLMDLRDLTAGGVVGSGHDGAQVAILAAAIVGGDLGGIASDDELQLMEFLECRGVAEAWWVLAEGKDVVHGEQDDGVSHGADW